MELWGILFSDNDKHHVDHSHNQYNHGNSKYYRRYWIKGLSSVDSCDSYGGSLSDAVGYNFVKVRVLMTATLRENIILYVTAN